MPSFHWPMVVYAVCQIEHVYKYEKQIRISRTPKEFAPPRNVQLSPPKPKLSKYMHVDVEALTMTARHHQEHETDLQLRYSLQIPEHTSTTTSTTISTTTSL
jgi:hypothetical protein